MMMMMMMKTMMMMLTMMMVTATTMMMTMVVLLPLTITMHARLRVLFVVNLKKKTGRGCVHLE